MSNPIAKMIGVAIAAAAATASCAGAPRTLPFQELQDAGVSFWMISPIDNAATYAFYSNGVELQFARSSEDGLRFGELTVSECHGLDAVLVQFEESLFDSIAIAFGREPAIPGAEIVMDSPNYRARIVPDNYLESINLEGRDAREVPWVIAGHEVFSHISACDNNR